MIEPLDYEAVGFISGLEVHQQLLTAHKLFCRCPGGLYTETHDGEVLRHMRPTLSELGEYDGTALMEFKTKKEIVYLLNHLNVCTYEMDDTPPFLVNQEAIDISHRAVPDDAHGHHRRGAHRPEAVPRRLDPDRLPAHGHRRRERMAAVQGPEAHRHPRQRRRGLVPRGHRQGAPHRLAHRPPGHAADRDRDRARAAHAGRGARRDPAVRHDGAFDAAACGPGSAPAART